MTVGRGRYVPRRHAPGVPALPRMAVGHPFCLFVRQPRSLGQPVCRAASAGTDARVVRALEHRDSRPVRRVAQAAVVTTLVAGAVGVSHYDKSVNLSVDGKASSVHAFGTTVADVLDKQDIKVGEHDVVVPSVGQQGRGRPEDRRPLRPQADASPSTARPASTGRPPPRWRPPCRSSASAPTPPSSRPRARRPWAAKASRSAVTTPKAVDGPRGRQEPRRHLDQPHRQGRAGRAQGQGRPRRPGQARP